MHIAPATGAVLHNKSCHILTGECQVSYSIKQSLIVIMNFRTTGKVCLSVLFGLHLPDQEYGHKHPQKKKHP